MHSTSGSSTQTVTLTRKADRGAAKKKTKKKIATPRNFAALVCVLLVVAYLSVAALIRLSVQIQSHLIYLNYVRIPFFADLGNPAGLGLRNTRNYDIVQYDGCPVSTWHILPDTYPDNVTESREYISALSDGAPIVLYLHGNTGARGTPHRILAYQSLSRRGYHVIAFDYRGYGDSQCVPSERGMMEDALLQWDWIKTQAPGSQVFIWGHSLGSAAATYLAKEIWSHRHTHPQGVILDAPFTSMIDAASNHPFGIPYWPVMSIFRYLVLESFQERFESESRLVNIPFPLLIAHGHNDIIIPFHLGERMYQTALEARRRNPYLTERLHFVDCGESTHKTNYDSEDLHQALDHFIDRK